LDRDIEPGGVKWIFPVASTFFLATVLLIHAIRQEPSEITTPLHV
jgi:hypothetical protein